MFEINNLSKRYGTEFALNDVTMSIGKGMNFIVGASGSGKTTLLKIMSGMEKGFEGSVSYCGKNIDSLTDKEKSALYNSTFGFVWQDFHLIEEATALENVLLATHLKGENAKDEAVRYLKQIKLGNEINEKVKFLSGGQKQRVAIARELMKNPKVIFCDEPTSALDEKSSKIIIEVLRTLSKRRTVIVVTHDTSLIKSGDSVFEFDKGELISATENNDKTVASYKEPVAPKLKLSSAFKIAFSNIKNKFGRFAISVLSLMIAGVLLLTTFSGAIGKESDKQFDDLFETYGDTLLDLSVIGEFMSASGTGGGDNGPSGDVSQNINGLYEKYLNDERVSYVISLQAYENIKTTIDGNAYTVEKTGSSPVFNKLVAGEMTTENGYEVIIPKSLAEKSGKAPETLIGKEIEFSATVFQWVNNQPLEKPVKITAKITGVADNTAFYEYEGQVYPYSVDDSFIFNKKATDEMRKQAGIENKSYNFTIRANTPEDLISLKDELNKNGIVPLGQFELIEDIVRLNQQTTEQSGSASVVIGVLAVVLAVVIFAMTSALRKREYAIYKVSGYSTSHLSVIALAENVIEAITAFALMLVTSPLLNMATKAMFSASILSVEKLAIGALLTLAISVVAFASNIPFIATSSVSAMLKASDKS